MSRVLNYSIIHNLCPSRWYNKWLKAKNRINSSDWNSMENQTSADKTAYSRGTNKSGGKLDSPSWLHVQLGWWKTKRGTWEFYKLPHYQEIVDSPIVICGIIKNICIWSLPCVLGTELQTTVEFPEWSKCLFLLITSPFQQWVDTSKVIHGVSTESFNRGSGQTHTNRRIGIFSPTSQPLRRERDLETEGNPVANNFINHTWVMRPQ